MTGRFVDGWWRPAPGPVAWLLAPAAFVVGRIAAERLARSPRTIAPVPVFCVGNPTVGGAGKTPMAILLAHLLGDRGLQPMFLTRGYRGCLAGPVRVDPDRHGAADVGDEPLLLARTAPTIVARDRAAGAELAVREGASAIVMDDGFQNPALAKDWSCLVVDAAVGVGNGMVVPAGPLRAPLGPQFARADLLVMMDGGDAASSGGPEGTRLPAGGPAEAVRARLCPVGGTALTGQRVLAFAGIGRPAKFFATCRKLGAEVHTRGFPDHHPFSAEEARSLLADAERLDAMLATTAKDAARLAMTDGAKDDPRRRLLAAARVVDVAADLAAEDRKVLTASLERALDAHASRAAQSGD